MKRRKFTLHRKPLVIPPKVIVPPNPLIRILIAARAKVAVGWTQHQSRDYRGRVCAGYAMDSSVTELFGETEEARQLQTQTWQIMNQAVTERYPIYTGSIVAWNDTVGRTHQQVLDTFDRAIKIAERKR